MTWAAAFAISFVTLGAVRAWELWLDFKRDSVDDDDDGDDDEGDELDRTLIARDPVQPPTEWTVQ